MSVGLKYLRNLMANNNGPINSWSLVAFARMKGKMQVGSFVNENGEAFKSCVFTDPNNTANKCFVHFSPKLGELTPAEIAAQKDNLQVVENLTKGNKQCFTLCHTGKGSWDNVDLGI